MAATSSRFIFRQKAKIMTQENTAKQKVSNGCDLSQAMSGFFYKYEPLSNRIVKNNPFQNQLLKIAWRKEEKAPCGASAKGCGGKKDWRK
jgi:hypothetical protein